MAECVLDVFYVWGTASMKDKDNIYNKLHSHYLVFNYLANHNNLLKDEHSSPHLHWSCYDILYTTLYTFLYAAS